MALGTAFFLASPLFALFDFFLTLLTNLLNRIFVGFSANLGFDVPVNLEGFNNFLPTEEEAAGVIGFTIPAEVTRLLTILIMLAVALLLVYHPDPPLPPACANPTCCRTGSRRRRQRAAGRGHRAAAAAAAGHFASLANGRFHPPALPGNV